LVAMVSSHSQIHQNYLSGNLNVFRLYAWDHAHSAMIGGFTRHGAAPFYGMLYAELERQATVMAFVDDFRLIAYIFFALTPVVFVMRRPQSSAGSISAH